MLENFMWKSFETTGNINDYLSYKQVNQFNLEEITALHDVSQEISLNQKEDETSEAT